MELDTKGFVIIDSNRQPFCIKLLHGKPVMLKWIDKRKIWVTAGKLDESMISAWAKCAIPDEHAELYHKQHEETTGINPTKF